MGKGPKRRPKKDKGDHNRLDYACPFCFVCSPDFVIDGVRYELKTLSGVINETADGISGAIANRVMNCRGQATDIIVDARNQAGITEEMARRGIRRAFGADNKTGGKITSITIHGPGWTIVVPRI